MTALVYLEWHAFRNGVAKIVRSPLRLLLWLGILAYFVAIAGMRQRYSLRGDATSSGLFAPPVASAIGGALLAVCGLLVLTSNSGRFFRSPAEARLIASSGVPWRTIAVWLDLRLLRDVALRGFPLIAFYLIALAHPRGNLPASTAIGFGAMIFVGGAVGSARLLTFVVFRRVARWVAIVVGGALALFGFAALAGGFLSMAGDPGPFAHFRGSAFDPGPFIQRLVAGNLRALAVVLLVPIASLAAVWADRGESMPELYELAMRGALAKRGEARGLRPAHGEGPTVGGGVATILWLDWTTFLRSPFARSLTIFGLVASIALGTGLAIGIRHGLDPDVAWSIVWTLGTSLLAQPAIATIELANHLAKPLWWFSVAPLRSRLAAWTFARSWRTALVAAIAPAILGCSVAGWRALLVFPGALLAFWFLNAIGVAVYGLFPSAVDQRSPIYIVRVFVGILLVAPAIAILLALIAIDQPLLAALASTAFVVIETVLLVEFATYRIGRNAAGIALLERSQ